VGKISLPSTILQFVDLGGQSGIRSIWPRYYADCHAVLYVLDASDAERLGEGWEVFGAPPSPPLLPLTPRSRAGKPRRGPERATDPRRPAPAAREQAGRARRARHARDPRGVRGVVPGEARGREPPRAGRGARGRAAP
jgi:hypothetical protein